MAAWICHSHQTRPEVPAWEVNSLLSRALFVCVCVCVCVFACDYRFPSLENQTALCYPVT